MAQDVNGFFIQGGLGKRTVTYKALQEGYTGQATDNSGSLAAGYRFNDYLGIEAAYWKLGNLQVKANTSAGLTGTDVATIKALTTGGFVTLPLGSSFELSARAGLRRWQMDEVWNYSSGLNGTQIIHGSDGYGGIGMAFLLNKNIATVVNVTRFKSPSVNVKIGNEIEIGLQYRFGK